MSNIKLDDNLLRIFLLTLLIYIVYNFILIPLDFLLPMRLNVNDAIFNIRNISQNISKPIDDIVVIGIDEKSLFRSDKRWPWTRGSYADIVDKISSYNSKVLSLDVTFVGKSENQNDDLRLAESLKNAGNVVIAGFVTDTGEYLFPHEMFTDAARNYGFVNKSADKDLKIRKARLVYKRPGYPKSYYGFEVVSLAGYFDVPLEDIVFKDGCIIFRKDSSSSLAQDMVIPVDSRGLMDINYSHPKNLQVISLSDVLNDKGELNDILRDKIILFGATSKTLHDIYNTPYGIMPGVLINAYTVNTLLNSLFIYGVPKLTQFLLILILMCLIAYLTYRLSLGRGMLFFWLVVIVILSLFVCGAFFRIKIDYFSFLFLALASYVCCTSYKYGYIAYSNNKLKTMVITDGVTGLSTPRYFQFKLQLDLSMESTGKSGIGVVVFMVSGLDSVLELKDNEEKNIFFRQIGLVFKQNSRKKADLLTRWSEDEFAAILQKTDIKDAVVYAEKIIGKLRSHEFLASKGQAGINAYAGIAHYPSIKVKSAKDLIACARTAGKRAQVSGDAVCVFDQQKDKVQFYGIYDEKKYTEEEYLSIDIEEREKELLKTLDELKSSQREIQKAHFETILSLVKALEEKDPYTAGHSERVARYAVGIAREMGLNEEEMLLIRETSLLHDIGKFGLSDGILHKKEKLTDEEVSQIRKHPAMGARIFEKSKFFARHIPYVLHHHERFDGKGYPHGLSGKFIPKGAHIIAIADAIDAMTSGRGYNRVLNINETIDELKKSSGTHFDQDYIEAAINFLKKS